MKNVILETRKCTKKYGDFVANHEIDLEIVEGEIRAICGENGAGKSTLMNTLYGVHEPTSGSIIVKGEERHFKTPKDAMQVGIGMIHQHFMLVPSLRVYENVFLGAEQRSRKNKLLVDQNFEKHACENLIDKYEFQLDANEKVENLSVGQQQKIEILKMLYRNVDILILDEPTSVLTPQETQELLIQLKELKSQGKTIIIITHKLNEVMDVSDNVTVIKGGRVVGTVKTSETSIEELAQMMVGRDVVLTVANDYKKVKDPKVLYKVDQIKTINSKGSVVLDNVSFQINEGEILGIAGVEGNGQSELVKVLSGTMETISGSIQYKGQDITNLWSNQLRERKLGFIPEDRYVDGLCQSMTLKQNAIAGNLKDKNISKNFILNNKNISDYTKKLIHDYNVVISNLDGNVSQLSGGNAQKLIIGRELDKNPDLIIASQPTRGVDIGAIEFIHKKLIEHRNNRKGVLLISSELSEIMSLSDRVLIMFKGSIIGEVNPRETTETEIGLLMAGAKKEGNTHEISY